MYRPLSLMLLALVALLVVGCASPAASAPGDQTPAVVPGTTASPLETPVTVPDTATSPLETPATGPTAATTPEVAAQAAEWLATEAGVAADQLRLVSAERTEWTDSCFGLGGPAESCLQAMTPGWRITFEAAGKQYEVRTDESGTSFRLAPQGS